VSTTFPGGAGTPFENYGTAHGRFAVENSSEHFTLADADTISAFAGAHGLAGLHYWSYDRDVDCAPGPASSTCNSLGGAGTYGFLARFIAAAPH